MKTLVACLGIALVSAAGGFFVGKKSQGEPEFQIDPRTGNVVPRLTGSVATGAKDPTANASEGKAGRTTPPGSTGTFRRNANQMLSALGAALKDPYPVSRMGALHDALKDLNPSNLQAALDAFKNLPLRPD
ncbi:MAG: hypothetical protein AAF514_10460, partial [Verrucomicrobiota bacterium]